MTFYGHVAADETQRRIRAEADRDHQRGVAEVLARRIVTLPNWKQFREYLLEMAERFPGSTNAYRDAARTLDEQRRAMDKQYARARESDKPRKDAA